MPEIEELVIDKIAYETEPGREDRGYGVRATYLIEPKGEALIEILKDGECVRHFLFPAYKIYNISAHFSEIVDDLVSGDERDLGLRHAAWTGIGPL